MPSLSATVLVVGAGPVGLWLAFELRRANVDVLVIDSKLSREHLAPFSKALFLSAGSLATFDSRGVADLFVAEGVPLAKGHWGGLSTLLELNHATLGTRHSCNVAIPQARTERILLKLCEESGVRFAWGLSFVGLVQETASVLATVENMATDVGLNDAMVEIEASWLVGCDGTHSLVRKAAAIPFEGIPSNTTGFLADLRLESPFPGLTVKATSKGSYMMINVGDGVHHRFTAMPRDGWQAPASQPVTLDEVREGLVDAFGSDLGAHSPAWMSRTGNACRRAPYVRAGRVFLAGDSAHQLFPAGGQGMNLGIQDATNLAWKLTIASQEESKNGGGNTEVVERFLDSYNTERVPISATVMDNVLAQIACFIASKEHEVALRSVFTEALKTPSLNTLWARRLTGLGEPRESYLIDALEQDELVGTVLHYLRLGPSGDDHYQQNSLDCLTLLLRKDCADAEDVVGLQTEAATWNNRVRVLALETVSGDSRWDDVIAVLIRPDLRIAWACRKELSPAQRVSSLSSTLHWWFG